MDLETASSVGRSAGGCSKMRFWCVQTRVDYRNSHLRVSMTTARQPCSNASAFCGLFSTALNRKSTHGPKPSSLPSHSRSTPQHSANLSPNLVWSQGGLARALLACRSSCPAGGHEGVRFLVSKGSNASKNTTSTAIQRARSPTRQLEAARFDRHSGRITNFNVHFSTSEAIVRRSDREATISS
jgi:hypothetical protein